MSATISGNKLTRKLSRYQGSARLAWISYQTLYHLAGLGKEFRYALARLRRGQKGSLEVDIGEGLKMHVDPHDRGLSKDLVINPDRESLSQIMLNEIGAGDTVVDLGANLGFYALKESKRVGPGGKVVAIEPVQKNFEWLNANIELNGLDNVETYRRAIGDKNEEAEIFVGEKLNWSTLVGGSAQSGSRPQRVQMNTLKALCEECGITPNLVRMDVEGYEYEIIEGSIDYLASLDDLKLMIEVHPHLMGREKCKQFLSMLKSAGFEAKIVVFENPLYPYVKPGSWRARVLGKLFAKFRVYSDFNRRRDLSMMSSVRTDLPIDEMLRNDDLLDGELTAPHVLFSKVA